MTCCSDYGNNKPKKNLLGQAVSEQPVANGLSSDNVFTVKKTVAMTAVLCSVFAGGAGFIAAPSMAIEPMASATMIQQIQVPVRASQQASFSRVVFDFPVEVPFQVVKTGQRLDIVFEASFSPTFSAGLLAGLREVNNPQFTTSGGTTTISMTVGIDAYPRQYRQGASVVVDVYPQTPAFVRDRTRRMQERLGQVTRGADQAGSNTGAANRATQGQQNNQSNDQSGAQAASGQSAGQAAGGAANQAADQQNPNVQNGAQTGAQNQGNQAGNDGNTAAGGDAASKDKDGQAAGSGAAGDQDKKAEDQKAGAADRGAADQGQTKDEEQDKMVNPLGGDKATTKLTLKPKPKADRNLDGVVSADKFDSEKKQAENSGDKAGNQQKDVNQGPEYQAGQSKGLTERGDLDVKLEVSKKSKGVIFETKQGKVQDGASLTVNVTSLSDLTGVTFAFSMPNLVPAAAFERHGNLWVIFDGKMDFDSRGLLEARNLLEGRVQGVYPLEHPDATILRMAISSNQNLVMEIIQNQWVLQLKDTLTRPRFPLTPQRRNDTINGNHIFVEASQIGTKLTFEDPTIGDDVVVLPLLGMGRGVVAQRDYAEAILLQTAQGIAIEPLSDKVLVNRFRSGVAIKTEVLSRTGDVSAISAQKLVDFDAWRVGGIDEFKKYRDRLLLKVSLAGDANKNKFRWDLARFYLAHRRSSDALGVMGLMLEEDPTLERQGEFLAVRGIANFQLGRMAEAGNDLFKTTLNGEQDVELWRAMIKEDRGMMRDTLNHYRRGKDIIGGYSSRERAMILLSVIRAALAEEEYKLAEQELNLVDAIDKAELSPAQVTESRYLRGVLAEAQGKQSEALAIYDEVSTTRDRRLSAYARYSRVKHNMRMGDIKNDDAIAELERLTFAWRGPKFESKVTSDLVDLYVENRDYTAAFDALKVGTIYYRDAANDERFPQRMRQLFKDLYLNGAADSLAPSRAVAMFFKYQENNPKGAEGDRIVLKLADRLEQMDLLDDAAELLSYLIKSRIETQAGKADTAAELARIYVLDRKPEKALDIIRATKQMDLPQDILNRRRWIEAKALIEMGRYEEAEVHLEDDGSKQALELRADLYWGSQDYDKVISSTDLLLADKWRKNEVLDSKMRLYLIRSCIAMAFNRDKAGLRATRERYGRQMRVGDLATAFELLTNQEELSGGELGSIVEQIAGINKLKTFMRDYKKDFNSSATGR